VITRVLNEGHLASELNDPLRVELTDEGRWAPRQPVGLAPLVLPVRYPR
jgi:hypothetical protein